MAGLAGLLVLTSLVALIGQARADASSAQVTERAMPALVAVERLERAFVDEQNAVRGYLLTGRDDLLQPYRRAATGIAGQEAALREAMSSNSAVVDQLDVVLRAHRAWLDVAGSAVTYKQQARQAELDRLLAERPGTPLFQDLQAQTGRLRELIEQEVAADAAEVAVVRGVLTWLLVAAAVVALLSVVLAVRGIRRSVTRPLGALVDAVERVADGDLDRPVPTTGPPEFAAVGGAVDRMRQELNDQRRSAVLAAELRESERVGAELRDGVVRRLFGVSTALTGLAVRHTGVAGELAWPIDELDQAIRDVRSAATGVRAPVLDRPATLAARISDVLARVPGTLGVHPDLLVTGTAGPAVPATYGDVLVTVLDDALDRLAAHHPRLDEMAVELAAADERWTLCLSVRGLVPGDWGAQVRAHSAGQPVSCRVTDQDPERTLVEWSSGP